MATHPIVRIPVTKPALGKKVSQHDRPDGRETPGNPAGPAAERDAGTPREAPNPPKGFDGEPVELPIDGSLDLHPFRPKDVASVVEEYLDECGRRGIRSIRIAHGKGIGTLREIVHGVLRRRADVASFRLDGETGSGWGATLVELRDDQNAD